jgi:Zn-dependent protease with chaperone function
MATSFLSMAMRSLTTCHRHLFLRSRLFDVLQNFVRIGRQYHWFDLITILCALTTGVFIFGCWSSGWFATPFYSLDWIQPEHLQKRRRQARRDACPMHCPGAYHR